MFTPEKWYALFVLLDEFVKCNEVFTFFSISLSLRRNNIKKDKLVRSARLLFFDNIYVNFIQVWIFEPF